MRNARRGCRGGANGEELRRSWAKFYGEGVAPRATADCSMRNLNSKNK